MASFSAAGPTYEGFAKPDVVAPGGHVYSTMDGNTQLIPLQHPEFATDNKVIFNIKGNTYRLVIKAKYQNGVVLVEWVGTHAEYDKLKL